MHAPSRQATDRANSKRETLLRGRERARAALAHPDLPQPIRDLYKRAYDKADAALGLQDAMARKASA